MRLPVELLPGAVTDAREAYAWYLERSENAAQAFMAELQSALDQVAAAPQRWPGWLHDTHRALLRRFPFFVVYRIQDTAIWVVAVAHARRRPDYWRTR